MVCFGTSQIKKVDGYKCPLNDQFFQQNLACNPNSPREKLTLVYGTLDPSCNYIPFIDRYFPVKIIEGADHNFKGKNQEFNDVIWDFLELREKNIEETENMPKKEGL